MPFVRIVRVLFKTRLILPRINGPNVDRELEFCFTPTSYRLARHSVECLANESDGCFKKFLILKDLIYLFIYILNWNQAGAHVRTRSSQHLNHTRGVGVKN